LLHADCDSSTQVTEKTTSSGEHGAQNRHPVYSTPTLGAYSSSRTFLTGSLAFDSPPLVSGLRSYPGTLSHFSFQPGTGEYSPGLLTFDGSARDAEVRLADVLPHDRPRWTDHSMKPSVVRWSIEHETSHEMAQALPCLLELLASPLAPRRFCSAFMTYDSACQPPLRREPCTNSASWR